MNKILKFLAVSAFTFTACSTFFATASYAYSDSAIQAMRKTCHAEGKRAGIRADGSLGCGTGLKEIETSGTSEKGIRKEEPTSSPRPTKNTIESSGKSTINKLTVQ